MRQRNKQLCHRLTRQRKTIMPQCNEAAEKQLCHSVMRQQKKQLCHIVMRLQKNSYAKV